MNPHFHTTDDVVYVSYLHPDTGALTLRCYLVNPGGVLEEWRYEDHRKPATYGDD